MRREAEVRDIWLESYPKSTLPSFHYVVITRVTYVTTSSLTFGFDMEGFVEGTRALGLSSSFSFASKRLAIVVRGRGGTEGVVGIGMEIGRLGVEGLE